MKLELRFSVWVTRNWPGTGSDFQNQRTRTSVGPEKVFDPILGLGWNENIERYLPDTSQYKWDVQKLIPDQHWFTLWQNEKRRDYLILLNLQGKITIYLLALWKSEVDSILGSTDMVCFDWLSPISCELPYNQHLLALHHLQKFRRNSQTNGNRGFFSML